MASTCPALWWPWSRWKLPGRKVPLSPSQGGDREGYVSPPRTQTDSRGISGKKESESLTLLFGCLPVHGLVCCLLGVSLGKKKTSGPISPRTDRTLLASSCRTFCSSRCLSRCLSCTLLGTRGSLFHHQLPRPSAEVTGWHSSQAAQSLLVRTQGLWGHLG